MYNFGRPIMATKNMYPYIWMEPKYGKGQFGDKWMMDPEKPKHNKVHK